VRSGPLNWSQSLPWLPGWRAGKSWSVPCFTQISRKNLFQHASIRL